MKVPSWADKGSNGTVGARRSGGVCTNTSTSYIYRPQYRPIRFPFATSDQQPLELFKKGNDKKPSKEKLKKERQKQEAQNNPQEPNNGNNKGPNPLGPAGVGAARKAHDERNKKGPVLGNNTTPIGNNGVYKSVIYHPAKGSGRKSPGPKNGQDALNNSVRISEDTSRRRVGISEGEIVVLDQTYPGEFHGHVRTWDEIISGGNKTTESIKIALIDNGLVNIKGKILK